MLCCGWHHGSPTSRMHSPDRLGRGKGWNRNTSMVARTGKRRCKSRGASQGKEQVHRVRCVCCRLRPTHQRNMGGGIDRACPKLTLKTTLAETPGALLPELIVLVADVRAVSFRRKLCCGQASALTLSTSGWSSPLFRPVAPTRLRNIGHQWAQSSQC